MLPTPGISLGCDYNPERWPPDVWREDVALMREAGVGFVTLGVFAPATIPARGVDLLSGDRAGDGVTVAAGGAVVNRAED